MTELERLYVRAQNQLAAGEHEEFGNTLDALLKITPDIKIKDSHNSFAVIGKNRDNTCDLLIYFQNNVTCVTKLQDELYALVYYGAFLEKQTGLDVKMKLGYENAAKVIGTAAAIGAVTFTREVLFSLAGGFFCGVAGGIALYALYHKAWR